eukprot:gnl/Dysnectes_brevis/6418_a9943_248.p1 GENE.gnl/Dysnectes_brevis/6418_a9943_248~~gnl/Dysnectes_brevis/6418_a9943_248.p1  ORF type:complete len:356 (+),score=-12.27 gnl/Dysnectes_brevis/6418_a9943_248:89-1069(+)
MTNIKVIVSKTPHPQAEYQPLPLHIPIKSTHSIEDTVTSSNYIDRIPCKCTLCIAKSGDGGPICNRHNLASLHRTAEAIWSFGEKDDLYIDRPILSLLPSLPHHLINQYTKNLLAVIAMLIADQRCLARKAQLEALAINRLSTLRCESTTTVPLPAGVSMMKLPTTTVNDIDDFSSIYPPSERRSPFIPLMTITRSPFPLPRPEQLLSTNTTQYTTPALTSVSLRTPISAPLLPLLTPREVIHGILRGQGVMVLRAIASVTRGGQIPLPIKAAPVSLRLPPVPQPLRQAQLVFALWSGDGLPTDDHARQMMQIATLVWACATKQAS